MKYKLLQIIIYYYFLSNNIYFTYEQFSDPKSNSIIKNQPLNKYIEFGENNTDSFFKYRLENNDILIISTFNERCFIYGLKSNGENYYEYENNTNYKAMTLSREFLYLNGAIVKIEKKEYPLLCDINLCRLIDYEGNTIYQINFNEFFEEKQISWNTHFLSFQIINLNNGNEILFCIRSKKDILLSKINILSKNLEFQQKSNFNGNQNYLQVDENINKLNCFITEKKMIECLYINENKYWIAIFDELLVYKTKIVLEKEEYIIKKDEDYFNFNNCIHLKKEIGIFTYYIRTKEMDNIQLHLQINELVFSDNNYIFNKFKNQNIIISLNNDNSSDFIIYDYFSNKNLMKFSDNRFSYVFNNFDGSIVLVIFDLYDNDKNLMIKYYKINLNLLEFTQTIFLYVETLNYNSFIGISFIISENYNYKKPLLAIFGNSDYEDNTKIILYENKNIEMKINEYINTKLNNNIFGYEVFFKISYIQECLNNIKLISIVQNKNIEINDTLSENDIILFDFTKINDIIEEPPFIEIKRIISEPEYEKYITLYDKIDIYGDDEQKFYKKKIIEEKAYKFIFNFSCYPSCENCFFGSFSEDNQKCLSCKSEENLCFMEKNKSCYNISMLIYNYYKHNITNEIICVPHGEFCLNEYPFEIRDTKECVKECDYEDLVNKYKIASNEPNSIISVFDIIHDRIKRENFEEEINKEMIIEGYNITIQTTDSLKQKYYIDNRIITNLSIIDLSDCEKKLGLDKPLIIVKMDINENDNSSPYIEYLLINPFTFEKMDIDLCKDSKINIYVPFEISENYYELYKYVKNYGYDIFNPSDKFYNDICTPFTTYNNTDVLIRDRKSDFFYDYNFCEESCDFDDINIDINKAKCVCEINNEITPNSKISANKLLEYFYKIEYYSNFRIIFCGELVFSLNGLKNNYGSYITLCLISLFMVIMIVNIITNNKKVNEILNKILDEQKKIIIFGKNNDLNKNNDSLFNEKIKKLEVEKPQNNNNIIKKKKVKRKKKKYKSLTISKNVLQKMINDNDNSKRRLSNNKMKNEFNIISSPPKKKIIKRMSHDVKFNEYEDSKKKNNVSIFSKDRHNINKKCTTKEKKIDNITDIIINNIEKEKRKFFFNSEELNSLSYNYALEIDDRNFLQYYISLLKIKHLIIFTFLVNDDYNIFLSKLGLFIISFSLYLTVNAIFFSDSSIHKLYEEKGKYNFIYQIPKILYSTIISSIASIILKQLSLSEKDILKIKKKLFIKELEDVTEEVKKCIRIKYILFFVIGFIFFSFFWYYLSCFCCIFTNTQIPLIKDTLISYSLSMLYPFLLNILPGLLRIPSLKKNNRKILYNISRIIALI